MGGIVSDKSFVIYRAHYSGITKDKLDAVKSTKFVAGSLSSIEGILQSLINLFTGIDSRKIYAPVKTIIEAGKNKPDYEACEAARDVFNELPKTNNARLPNITRTITFGGDYQYTLNFIGDDGHPDIYDLAVVNKDVARKESKTRIKRLEINHKQSARRTRSCHKPLNIACKGDDSFNDREKVFQLLTALQESNDQGNCAGIMLELRAQCLDKRIRFKVTVIESEEGGLSQRCYWAVFGNEFNCIHVLNDTVDEATILEKDSEDIFAAEDLDSKVYVPSDYDHQTESLSSSYHELA